MRVAVAIEQALGRSNQRALAIHMDRAPFEHETFGVITRAPLDFQHLAAHLLVAVPRRIQAAFKTAPCVEIPVHTADFTVVVDHERRAAVTHPRVIAGHLDHTNIRHIQAGTGIFVLAGRHADRHRLEARDSLGHRRVRGLRWLATQTPVIRALGPDHPGLGVRRPFGRHVETVCAGRTVQKSGH